MSSGRRDPAERDGLHVGFEIDLRGCTFVAPPGAAAQERGVHGGRRDRVHAHPRRGLDRERAREPEHARLRGRVGAEARRRADREARSGIHDRGRVGLREQRQRGPAREPGRAQVAGDDLFPVLRARVARAGSGDARSRRGSPVRRAPATGARPLRTRLRPPARRWHRAGSRARRAAAGGARSRPAGRAPRPRGRRRARRRRARGRCRRIRRSRRAAHRPEGRGGWGCRRWERWSWVRRLRGAIIVETSSV